MPGIPFPTPAQGLDSGIQHLPGFPWQGSQHRGAEEGAPRRPADTSPVLAASLPGSAGGRSPWSCTKQHLQALNHAASPALPEIAPGVGSHASTDVICFYFPPVCSFPAGATIHLSAALRAQGFAATSLARAGTARAPLSDGSRGGGAGWIWSAVGISSCPSVEPGQDFVSPSAWAPRGSWGNPSCWLLPWGRCKWGGVGR